MHEYKPGDQVHHWKDPLMIGVIDRISPAVSTYPRELAFVTWDISKHTDAMARFQIRHLPTSTDIAMGNFSRTALNLWKEADAQKILAKTAQAALGSAFAGDNALEVSQRAVQDAKTYLAAATDDNGGSARHTMKYRPELLEFWVEGTEESIALNRAFEFLSDAQMVR